MKISIEIPKNFEIHFNFDRFRDSLERCSYEIDNVIRYDVGYNPITCKYDIEVLEMLIKEFEKAKIISAEEDPNDNNLRNS